MSETEAGASWQHYHVWGVNYPHHQYNLHQQSQYQPVPYHHHPHNHQSSSLNGNQSFLSTSGEQSMSMQSSQQQETSSHHQQQQPQQQQQQQHQQSEPPHYQRLSNTIRRQSVPYDASSGIAKIVPIDRSAKSKA